MQDNNLPKFKILSFKCGQIYEIMQQKDVAKRTINIRDDKGNLSCDLFGGYLDASLETDKLKEVYAKHKDELPLKFVNRVNKYDLTTAIINVDFNRAYKVYNDEKHKAGTRYVLAGYSKSDYEMHDHVCIQNIDGVDTLIAIEVPYYYKKKKYVDYERYGSVENCISKELLGKYFTYDKHNKAYKRKVVDSGTPKSIEVITKVDDIRKELYVNGFDCDGVHYVRYKRSAGRSREGSCLFIPEVLYDDMMRWSATGLDMDNISNLASWEAYIALTLSNKIGTISLPMSSILVMEDQYSVFDKKVMSIQPSKNDAEDIVAVEQVEEISNNLWDGESLLDVSVFEESGFGDRGMMVLRNNFFKTCAFNTNIQKWFKEEKITKPSELNGVTMARKLEDIKLITTRSSLKYLSMLDVEKNDKKGFKAAVEMWLKNIDKKFGIVKTDEPTKFMDGKLVSTTYQLMNTLPLTRDDVKVLIKDTIEYIENIKASPMFLRHYINYRLKDNDVEDTYEEEDDENEDAALLDYRYNATLDMLGKCDEFAGTQFYHSVQRSIVKTIKDKIKRGKVLVNGLYATLFGNGAELLKASTNSKLDLTESVLQGSSIYSKRFADGEELLCSRNPHVTMGNIFIATNRQSDFYDKYFNLTNEIVCINAIGENVQDRLNGCDYDSDTMLITNNALLLDRAKSIYDEFLVPTCDLEGSKKIYNNTMEDRAELDTLIAKSAIGQIVNLSQLLNSSLWDMRSGNHDEEKEKHLYREICKLAVLSGIEIDKAKRQYNINMKKTIDDIALYKRWAYIGNPKFFEYVNNRSTKKGISINTAMEYFYELGADENVCKDMITIYDAQKKPRAIKVESLVAGCKTQREANDYRYKADIIDIVRKAEAGLKAISKRMRGESESEKILSREKKAALLTKCLTDVEKKIKNNNIIVLLLRAIDNDKEIKGIANTLFGVLCNEKHHRFYDMVAITRTAPMYELEQKKHRSDKSIYIFGVPHEAKEIK